jgi:hypothetical protein
MHSRNGGIQLNKSEQQTLVAECRTSGMTAKAWCEVKGIKYDRYLYWATRMNKQVQLEPPQWAQVLIPKEERISSEIKLQCGKWTICVGNGFSTSVLADVLKVVDAVC